MASFPQLTRGRTVYGSGSYAPTRGPVSGPGNNGYVQRELRSRMKSMGVSSFGNDGMSDTRSGNAQRALKRIQANQISSGGQVNNSVPTSSVAERAYKANTAQGAQGGQGPHPGPGNVHQPPHGSHPVHNNGQHNSIRISANGTLNLPYNNEYSMKMLGTIQQYNADILKLQQDQATELADYAAQKRTLGTGYTDEVNASLNQSAGRGSLFSSAHAVDIGRDATTYNNALSQLLTQHTQAKSGFTAAQANAVTALNTVLAQEGLQRVNDLTKDAGTLGYKNPNKRKKNARRANRRK